jgi:hypothetical protein
MSEKSYEVATIYQSGTYSYVGRKGPTLVEVIKGFLGDHSKNAHRIVRITLTAKKVGGSRSQGNGVGGK